MPEYITEEELNNLKKELEYSKTVKMKEIAELIKHTASFGDLKENFAYHDAKEKQGFLHGKIMELQEKIRNARIIKIEYTGKVQISSKVIIELDGEKQEIIIVSTSQADPLKGKISCESPIGKALMGKEAESKIKVNIEGDKIDCKILKIE